MGIATGWSNSYTSEADERRSADMSTGIDELTRAVYVTFREGVSMHGTSERP